MKKTLYFLLIVSVISCNSPNNKHLQHQTGSHIKTLSKINGISFVATRDSIDHTAITPVKNYNANYAAIIPYAWMKSLEQPQVNYEEDRGWWGEKPHGVASTANQMKDQGIEVLLKPQLWIGRGDYTGNIKLESEEAWKVLEDSYTDYIMRFVHIAAKENVGMFCIGTELDSFVKERPAYWLQLIKNIREVYSGKLTYAANWDNYKHVTFWNDLDYVGVDAYFPLSDEKTPNAATLQQNWQKWKNEMKGVSEKYGKKILFSEYGYISADYAGKEPWKNAGEDRAVNEEAQQVLLQGLYDNVWQEEWMAGGFIWKHHAEKSRRRGYEKRFTPQGKKAQATVTEAYRVSL
ncbi:glycoside hydrolase [Nonlabens sp.]|uniref:glycoside hydrolase family 113 n=1 Tax=Nonlabens sp. TaxID=1888209 RepID=UPI001BCCC75E|nr:glycoside hydrolase [Nonlabens sp.]